MNIQDAAHRVYVLLEQKAEIEAEVKELKAEFFSSLPVGESLEAGEFKVSAQRNARFDPTLAAQVLTPTQFASILKTVPDGKLAKENLSPKDYRKAQREFDPKISVTIPKEG